MVLNVSQDQSNVHVGFRLLTLPMLFMCMCSYQVVMLLTHAVAMQPQAAVWCGVHPTKGRTAFHQFLLTILQHCFWQMCLQHNRTSPEAWPPQGKERGRTACRWALPPTPASSSASWAASTMLPPLS